MTKGSQRSDVGILIVEDDADIRDALTEILRSEGYMVTSAEHGRVALDHLRARRPYGLILLDLMMPVMNGWEFRAELRRDPTLASIPVVVLSAVASEQQRTVLDAAGYIKKPIELDVLLATVEQHCRTAA